MNVSRHPANFSLAIFDFLAAGVVEQQNGAIAQVRARYPLDPSAHAPIIPSTASDGASDAGEADDDPGDDEGVDGAD